MSRSPHAAAAHRLSAARAAARASRTSLAVGGSKDEGPYQRKLSRWFPSWGSGSRPDE